MRLSIAYCQSTLCEGDERERMGQREGRRRKPIQEEEQRGGRKKKRTGEEKRKGGKRREGRRPKGHRNSDFPKKVP